MGVLWEYGVPESILRAIQSLYNQSKSWVHILSTVELSDWTPPGMLLVSDPVYVSHGQNLKVHLWKEGVWFENLHGLVSICFL